MTSMPVAALTYSTPNIGDEIQTLAALAVLNRVDALVDRDVLEKAPLDTPHACLMNGWWKKGENLLPVSSLNPILYSFHIANPALFNGPWIDYLKEHGPVGTRDPVTMWELKRRGVPAYWSGCLTSFIGEKLKAGPAQRRGTYIVDIPDEFPKDQIPETVRQSAIPFTQLMHPALFNPISRLSYALKWLSIMASAEFVISGRLHVCSPVNSLGAPVLFLTSLRREPARNTGFYSFVPSMVADNPYVKGNVWTPVEGGKPPEELYAHYRTMCGRLKELGIYNDRSYSILTQEERFLFFAERIGGFFEDHKESFLTGELLWDVLFAQAQGHWEKAVEMAGQVLELNPDSEVYRIYLEKLNERRKEAAGQAQVPASDAAPPGAAAGDDIAVTVRSVVAKGLTYLPEKALGEIAEAVRSIEDQGLEGCLLEAGCALGGSAIVMAKAKSQPRPLFVYDVFGMIPPPTDKDGEDAHERFEVIKEGRSRGIRGGGYYGYEEDLYGAVQKSFAGHGFDTDAMAAGNISLVKGLFEDTMEIDGPVALAHIDCDWYDSVMCCLERIEPHLVAGGRLVIDDYMAWSGCKKAVNDFFEDRKDQYRFEMKSRLHIIKL